MTETIEVPRLKRKSWFGDRVGSIVYRGSNGCECSSCNRAKHDGIFIRDEAHAMYLNDMEADRLNNGKEMVVTIGYHGNDFAMNVVSAVVEAHFLHVDEKPRSDSRLVAIFKIPQKTKL